MLLSDLQHKDIVNMTDGKNIGNIIDVIIDPMHGSISSLIIEPSKGMKNFLKRGEDTEIRWEHIKKIGEDVILVNMGYNGRDNNG